MTLHKKNNQLLVGKLKEISKALGKYYSVKIGILANNNKPISENLDLAGLGAVQEYGAKIKVTPKMRAFLHYMGVHLNEKTTHINIPARSWLYEPIKSPEFRKLIYDYVGDEELLAEYGDKDIMKELANIIGEAGLFQIQKAFETSGNGQWAPNSAITIRQKGSSKPLIDTGRLRGSITYEVENA